MLSDSHNVAIAETPIKDAAGLGKCYGEDPYTTCPRDECWSNNRSNLVTVCLRGRYLL